MVSGPHSTRSRCSPSEKRKTNLSVVFLPNDFNTSDMRALCAEFADLEIKEIPDLESLSFKEHQDEKFYFFVKTDNEDGVYVVRNSDAKFTVFLKWCPRTHKYEKIVESERDSLSKNDKDVLKHLTEYHFSTTEKQVKLLLNPVWTKNVKLLKDYEQSELGRTRLVTIFGQGQWMFCKPLLLFSLKIAQKRVSDLTTVRYAEFIALVREIITSNYHRPQYILTMALTPETESLIEDEVEKLYSDFGLLPNNSVDSAKNMWPEPEKLLEHFRKHEDHLTNFLQYYKRIKSAQKVSQSIYNENKGTKESAEYQYGIYAYFEKNSKPASLYDVTRNETHKCKKCMLEVYHFQHEAHLRNLLLSQTLELIQIGSGQPVLTMEEFKEGRTSKSRYENLHVTRFELKNQFSSFAEFHYNLLKKVHNKECCDDELAKFRQLDDYASSILEEVQRSLPLCVQLPYVHFGPYVVLLSTEKHFSEKDFPRGNPSCFEEGLLIYTFIRNRLHFKITNSNKKPKNYVVALRVSEWPDNKNEIQTFKVGNFGEEEKLFEDETKRLTEEENSYKEEKTRLSDKKKKVIEEMKKLTKEKKELSKELEQISEEQKHVKEKQTRNAEEQKKLKEKKKRAKEQKKLKVEKYKSELENEHLDQLLAKHNLPKGHFTSFPYVVFYDDHDNLLVHNSLQQSFDVKYWPAKNFDYDKNFINKNEFCFLGRHYDLNVLHYTKAPIVPESLKETLNHLTEKTLKQSDHSSVYNDILREFLVYPFNSLTTTTALENEHKKTWKGYNMDCRQLDEMWKSRRVSFAVEVALILNKEKHTLNKIEMDLQRVFELHQYLSSANTWETFASIRNVELRGRVTDDDDSENSRIYFSIARKNVALDKYLASSTYGICLCGCCRSVERLPENQSISSDFCCQRLLDPNIQ
ncbi:hypothetical protein L596_009370 [Steinernema carpocapsae]|uniref:Uncharacterized protein n=1 Tax=Steinernema carpocapsae TaxID=34508 RepID=A0A4U5PF56_STECR|nr:hypothetical protein L596_009370 [Steinernema carpocapsae]